MTYRERRERRANRRREWAEGRQSKATQSFTRADSVASGIPFGQPVLVGHHSERRHRRDLARIDSAMASGVAHSKMAEHHSRAADTIERQLENSIYSDDHDAAERLQAKIADLEAQRERMKAINSWLQKHMKAHGFKSRRLPGWERQIEEAERFGALLVEATHGLKLTKREFSDLASAYRHSGRIGYPPYALSNLAGNIGRTRKRLQSLQS